MIILIDNGHGYNTNGKSSPKLDSSISIDDKFISDDKFKEWKYNRVVSNKIVDKLKALGYDARLVVTEDKDVSLSERVRRINTICNKYGSKNVMMISIHSNACGNGSSWMGGNGWEAYTTKGRTTSDKLAELLYKEAENEFKGRKIRKDMSDGDMDKESDFYIIKKSYCPSVLTENFFYDNKEDLKYLTSDEGVESVVKVHVNAIKKFLS